jgi:hypothetical protein
VRAGRESRGEKRIFVLKTMNYVQGGRVQKIAAPNAAAL